MDDPLGIRSNNPGNLRPSEPPWLGQVGADPRGYCIFDTPEHGIRALAKNLLAYYTKHGLFTIRGIITRWAPSSENDTASYITAVSRDTGFGPDDALRLKDEPVLSALVSAIIRHENGKQPYTAAQLDDGVGMALA